MVWLLLPPGLSFFHCLAPSSAPDTQLSPNFSGLCTLGCSKRWDTSSNHHEVPLKYKITEQDHSHGRKQLSLSSWTTTNNLASFKRCLVSLFWRSPSHTSVLTGTKSPRVCRHASQLLDSKAGLAPVLQGLQSSAHPGDVHSISTPRVITQHTWAGVAKQEATKQNNTAPRTERRNPFSCWKCSRLGFQTILVSHAFRESSHLNQMLQHPTALTTPSRVKPG